MTLGQLIKRYRTDNDLTLKEFSAKSGISVAYISLLETGRQTHGKKVVPSLQMYYKCAAGMGITLNNLLEKIDDNEVVTLIQDPVERDRYDRMSEIQAIFDQLPEGKQEELLAYAKWQLDRK